MRGPARGALRWLLRGAAAMVIALPAVLHAEPSFWQAEIGGGVEDFSNDTTTWREADVALRARFAPRALAEGRLRQTRRRGFDDSELGAGLVLPLGADWSLGAAATLSPTHRVLARASGRFDLSRVLPGGWVLGAGLGRSLYDGEGSPPTGSSTLRLDAERYVGAWRFAAGLSRSRLDDGPSDDGWRLALDRYLGERGRVGVVLARGRELENEPALGGVLSTRVETLALVAGWPLAPDWTLTGALSRTRHSDGEVRTGVRTGDPVGNPYRRHGVRLGVQRDF
jgi:YaiO family outer membrane protein